MNVDGLLTLFFCKLKYNELERAFFNQILEFTEVSGLRQFRKRYKFLRQQNQHSPITAMQHV